MIIPRLCFTDLFSYEHLDLNLKSLGLVAVEGENRDLGGSNGSGKSNIFKGLCWIPFGKAPQDGQTISGDDVIREGPDHQPIKGRTRGYMEAVTEFAELQIYRHRGHDEYGNKLLLYANGKDETMGSDAETQLKLQEYLGIDYDAWVHAIMFPQDASGFAKLTDAKQKGVLDSLLGTERFERARKRAKEQLKPLLDGFQKLQGQLSTLRSQHQQQGVQVGNLQQQEAAWLSGVQDEIRQLTEQRKQLEQNPPTDVDAIGPMVARRDELKPVVEQRTLADLQHLRDGLLQEHATQKAAVMQLAGWRDYPEPVWDGNVPQGVDPMKVDQINEVVTATQREVDLLQSSVDAATQIAEQRESTTECGSCGQPLSGEAKDRMFGKLDTRLQTTTQSLADARQKLSGAQMHLDAAIAERDRVAEYKSHLISHENWTNGQAALMTADAELARIESEGGQLKQSIALRQEYEDLSTRIQDASVAQHRWQEQITQLQVAVKNKSDQPSPYKDLISSAYIAQSETSRKIEKLEATASRLDDQIGILRFWEDGFGPKGVRSLLLDHITPEINRLSNEYLDILSSGTAKMAFHTTKQLKNGDRRDNFHVEVEYQNGAGAYKKISGGERQRPDLAAMFALGDIAASRSRSPIQLRLLDEPFDGLDGLGAEQVVEVLRSKVLPKAGTVLVMTHDDNLKQLIDERIVVVKEEGVSRIL